MIPAEALFKVLEEKDLVPAEVLAELRAHVAHSLKTPKPINAAMAARILVEQGYLSRLLAQRLMSQIEAEWAAKNPRQKIEPLVLRPLEEAPVKDEETLSLADDVVDLVPLEEEPPRKTPAAPSSPPRAVPLESGDATSEAASGNIETPPSGPTEDLLSELLPSTSPTPATTPLAATWTSPRRKTPWESPLILFGGGGILLLLFAGVVLLWSLNRRSGDELLAEADADYHAGSYTQAIHKYTQFLDNFPRHPQAGPAKVRRGLAQIRQAVQTQESVAALSAIKEVLDQISPLPDFHAEADAELTAILPPLADNLARAALQKVDPALVEKGQEALAYCRRFIPQDKRPVAKLDEIATMLELARRRISQTEELTRTIGRLEELLAKGELDQTYEVRKKFLEDYPQARNNAELIRVMRRIAEAEKARVKFVEPSPVPNAPKRPPLEQTAVFAFLKKGEAPLPEDRVVTFSDQSSVFAIEARTGKLLWQRRTGESVATIGPSQTPCVLEIDNRPAIALPDRINTCIACLEAGTGNTLREIRLPEPPVQCALTDAATATVLGDSGRIYVVDFQEGKVLRELTLPQKPAFLPVLGGDPVRWYLVGEHSNIFVLDPVEGKCVDVWYVGHEPGQLCVPPVVIGEYLVLPMQNGEKTTQLRVLALSQRSGEPKESQATEALIQVIPLPGKLRTAVQVQGSRLSLITHEGHVQVYQLRAGDRQQPLVLLAEGKSPRGLPQFDQWVAPWVVLAGDSLLTADTSLAQFELQASAARLIPRWVACENTLAIAPPVIMDSTVFYTYRRPNRPGIFISALNATDGRSYWEVHLSDPGIALTPSPSDPSQVLAVTWSGHVAGWNRSGENQLPKVVQALATTEMPLVPSPEVEPLTCSPAPGLWLITYPGSSDLLKIDARANPPKHQLMRFAKAVAGPLLPLANGCTVGLDDGSLVWLPCDQENPQAVAYLGPTVPEETTRYSGAVALGDQGLIAADNRGHLVKLRLEGTPPDQFRLECERSHRLPFVSPLARLDKLVVISDAEKNLVFFDAETLQPTATIPLSSECIWGPVAGENLVYFLTAAGTFFWLSNASSMGQVAIGNRMPVGLPIRRGQLLLVATSAGDLITIDLTTEKITSTTQLQIPLASAGTLLGDELWLSTLEGCWLRVSLDSLRMSRTTGSETLSAAP
ncbi:PQQ-binding-like beta-propeller repeat protein [Thermogutta sp.]|uniref:outer membrane protein assembly factor BamB family protein n=1 Tax=Thermogutta sp. TaxID=1962930 RepID=UPI003C7C6F64